jgi:ketosteroid isomerase-like protein
MAGKHSASAPPAARLAPALAALAALAATAALAAITALAGCRAEEPPAVRKPVPSRAPLSREAETAAVGRVLDDWHGAAARADGERYFGHFAPDAVFLGTDATERWTVAEFRAFAAPYFDRGQGWTYTPRTRNVALSADGRTAWFDEVLDNASYGECRGTGVLRKAAGAWKIAHYSLTIPIPNDVAKEVVRKIREHGRAAPAPPGRR